MKRRIRAATSYEEVHAPYDVPYGLHDVLKMLRGTSPSDWWNIPEIEMDFGDGKKLERYVTRKVHDVYYDKDNKVWYRRGKYWWTDCYFYPSPYGHESNEHTVMACSGRAYKHSEVAVQASMPGTQSDDTSSSDEFELSTSEQEFTSEKTSINSQKLPAVYNMISIPAGQCGIDFGGGKFDNSILYLKDKGVTLVVYDPYNRSAEHNAEAVKTIRENGGADFAINSNVLNVIKEDHILKEVLQNIHKLRKQGAPLYLTVYEGDGTGVGKETKAGYQRNARTEAYLDVVREVFPDAKRRGKLITGTKGGAPVESADDVYKRYYSAIYYNMMGEKKKIYFECNGNFADAEKLADEIIHEPYTKLRVLGTISNIPLAEKDGFKHVEAAEDVVAASKVSKDKILEEVKDAVLHTMTTGSFGFPEDEAEDYSFVEGKDAEDAFVIEVRAEVSYSGMVQLADACNPVIQKYDPEAYFDQEEPGIMTAYLKKSAVTAAWNDPEPSLDPPEPRREPIDTEETIDFEFDLNITVYEDGAWDYDEDSAEELRDDTYREWTEYPGKPVDGNDFIEQFDEVIEANIPMVAGRYNIKGKAKMVYQIQNWYPEGEDEMDEFIASDDIDFDKRSSYVENWECESI